MRGLRIADGRLGICSLLFTFGFAAAGMTAPAPPADLFQQASQAYLAEGYLSAADGFGEASMAAPAPGTLHNLGNAEWQCGHTGPAIAAWERAQWLAPFDPNTKSNLRLARKVAQLEAPELVWYEICSRWLPVNVWSWLACVSFWLA